MATTTTGSAGMYGRINLYYDKLALEYLLPQLRLYQFAEKRPLPKHSGRTVIFARYAAPTADTALTEGTAPSAQSLSTVTVSATLEQLGHVFGVSDVLEMTAITSQVEEAVKQLADFGALSIDTYIRNAIIDGASVMQELPSAQGNKIAVSALYSADTLNSYVLRRTAMTLKRLNVRPFADGYYVWVTNSYGSEQLRSSTAAGEWLDVHKYAEPGNIFSGEIGRLHGFRVVESENMYTGSAAATSAVSVSAVRNIAFGKGFFAVTEIDGGVHTFVKGPNPYDKSDPLNQYSTVGYKATLASKLLNVSCGIVVPTAQTFI